MWWHHAETVRNEQNSSSNSDTARNFNIWKGHANPLFAHRDNKKNILVCLEGRETGASWSQASYGGYTGRNSERWTPFLEGKFVLQKFMLSCFSLSRNNSVYLFHFLWICNELFLYYQLGWNSPAVQFEGPAVPLVRKSYLSWCPTSCAYTSSAPSAQPYDRV